MSESERRWNQNPQLEQISRNSAYQCGDARRNYGVGSVEYEEACRYERETTSKINDFLLGRTNRCPY